MSKHYECPETFWLKLLCGPSTVFNQMSSSDDSAVASDHDAVQQPARARVRRDIARRSLVLLVAVQEPTWRSTPNEALALLAAKTSGPLRCLLPCILGIALVSWSIAPWNCSDPITCEFACNSHVQQRSSSNWLQYVIEDLALLADRPRYNRLDVAKAKMNETSPLSVWVLSRWG